MTLALELELSIKVISLHKCDLNQSKVNQALELAKKAKAVVQDEEARLSNEKSV